MADRYTKETGQEAAGIGYTQWIERQFMQDISGKDAKLMGSPLMKDIEAMMGPVFRQEYALENWRHQSTGDKSSLDGGYDNWVAKRIKGMFGVKETLKDQAQSHTSRMKVATANKEEEASYEWDSYNGWTNYLIKSNLT
jgi:hypothetical protein